MKPVMILAGFISLWMPYGIAFAETDSRIDVEYQIKASYLYNFLQFVKFPLQSLRNGQEVSVCIVGENRFGKALTELDGAKSPQGLVRVQMLDMGLREFENNMCNVLYIVSSGRSVAQELLKRIDSRRVLTIGESESFLRIGGSIELYVIDDAVRFRINVDQVKNADYQVAAQLMELGASM